MSLSIKVTNSDCQANCAYCYEKKIREEGRCDRKLKLDAVFNQMDAEWSKNKCGVPYLHGGEALTAGYDATEAILRKAYELAGRTSIQTYGYLIDRQYIEMFKRYNTSVGISLDGPYPLNNARAVKGYKAKEVTELVHRNILEMRTAGIGVSIICVLHKLNALPEPREKLKEWLLWLRAQGINGGRLNLMTSFGNADNLELTEDEAADAWVDLARFTLIDNEGLAWKPFRDAVDSLLGLEQGTCVFGKCQFYHAHTEPVILSDGKTATCLKTGATTGHIYPRYPDYRYYQDSNKGFGLVRYDVLSQVEQEYGGCKGCMYWRNCYGGCPASGLNDDWRNRSRFCGANYKLFETVERWLRGLMPNIILSCDKNVEFPAEGVRGMTPFAFSNMLKRAGHVSGQHLRVPVAKNAGCEHADGDYRHLDSGAVQADEQRPGDRFEHIDGNIRHLDSGY